ncbi:MAG: plasmid stabilization protein [Rhodospirillaceae bacterium]
MPRGDKSSYSNKQKRQAEHIEGGYEDKGVSHKEAEARAWATVNAMDGGGKKSGSGRGRKTNKAPARKGGRKGGAARKKTVSRKSASRSSSSRATAGAKRGRAPARKKTARKKTARKSTARKSARKKASR